MLTNKGSILPSVLIILAIISASLFIIYQTTDYNSTYSTFLRKPLTQATIKDIVTIAGVLFFGIVLSRK